MAKSLPERSPSGPDAPKRRPTLTSIMQSEMFCRFDLMGGQRLTILEKPGLWLSDEEIAAWAEPCRSIAKQSLEGDEMDYGLFSGDREFWSTAILTLIEDRKTEEPLAFNVMRLLPVQLGGKEEDVLHLGLTMVSPAARGRSLSSSLYVLTCVLYYFRRQCRPFWISNVSQVPAVIGMVSETFGEVYPGKELDQRAPARHLNLATQIMSNHRAAFGVSEDAPFREDRFVIEDAYRGGSDNLKKSFDEATSHRDPFFNDLCRQALNYERGDDFIQIGRANAEAARRILLRRLPGFSGLGLGLQLISLFLSSLVAPFAQWLNPKRPQGSLRARGQRG